MTQADPASAKASPKPRPIINSLPVWRDRETTSFAAALPHQARVLDAGAGDGRYREHFAHCSYEPADLEQLDKP